MARRTFICSGVRSRGKDFEHILLLLYSYGIYQMWLTSRCRRRRHPCLTSVWCFRDNYPSPTPDLVVLLLYRMYFYFFFYSNIYFIFGTCRERSTETTMGTHYTEVLLYSMRVLSKSLPYFFFSFIYNKYNGYVCVYRYNSGCTPNKNDKKKKPTTNLHNTGNRPWKQTHRHCSRATAVPTPFLSSFFISRHYVHAQVP